MGTGIRGGSRSASRRQVPALGGTADRHDESGAAPHDTISRGAPSTELDSSPLEVVTAAILGGSGTVDPAPRVSS
jgi:hypothetical protein